YSLNVEALPPAEAAAELEEDAEPAESGEDAPTAGRRRKAKRKTAMQDLPLLDLMGESEEATR
ncbi:MAG: hypothetical protein KDC14_01855, partial [Planctomycetes bacterium]|nr:hypothetical protein [Planctomycetota bacterium]